MFSRNMFTMILLSTLGRADQNAFTCRDRSDYLRQDGGLCFEVPPWQHQPVQLEQHVSLLRTKWKNSTDLSGHKRRNISPNHLALANSEISRYMDTVLAPFLDTYHRNIQNAYQQLTTKILRRIKEEVNGAIKRKQQVYKQLSDLANDLDVPAMCDEERRLARTVANNHVATIFQCSEDARATIAKMGKYAEDMIAITRTHMQRTMGSVAMNVDDRLQSSNLRKIDILASLKELSKSAVELGYELDLSLTNARRHNEQSCEKLSSCVAKSKRHTDDLVTDLKDQLYQCVYA